MAVNWISKGNPNCDGEPVISEPIPGILDVVCPKCSSRYTTEKR